MSSVRALRPMGLLEIIDQAFRLYRSEFLLFFGITAVVLLPVTLLQAIPAVSIIGTILGTFANLLASGALVKAISDRYLGAEVTMGSSYRYVWRRFWPFIVTMLVMYLALAGGMLLLMIPFFFVAFWCGFITQIFVIEDKRKADAIRRGKFLVGEGVWAQLLVLYLIVSVIALLVLGGLIFAVMIPATIGGRETSAAAEALMTIVAGLFQAVVGPFVAAATTLLYYDSRIRKEGFDLQILAQELGASLPSSSEPVAVPPASEASPAATAAEPPTPPTPPEEGSV